MKKILMFMCALMFACGAPSNDDVTELVSVDQPLLINETNSGAFRLPGAIEFDAHGALVTGQSQGVQCLTSQTGECIEPHTKTVNVYIDSSFDSQHNRSLAQSAIIASQNDANNNTWSGTPLDDQFAPCQ